MRKELCEGGVVEHDMPVLLENVRNWWKVSVIGYNKGEVYLRGGWWWFASEKMALSV